VALLKHTYPLNIRETLLKMFFPNQIEAGETVVKVFASGDYHYSLLCAETQSGKSGTFHYIAQKMLQNNIVDHVCIVCPSAEVELREQAENDAMEYNYSYVRSKKMSITFRTAFKKTMLPTKRSLWIIDESHLDQDKGQEMDQFLKMHGLTMAGTTPKMKNDQTYILSVSATPYSEFSDIMYQRSFPKFIQYLKPGNGYIGASDYLYRGLIKPTFSIEDAPERFMDMVLAGGNRYSIIRLTSGPRAKAESVLRANCRSKGIRLVFFTQDTDEVIVSKRRQVSMMPSSATTIGPSPVCLSEEPSEPTLVVVKGRLRCGKVVPKEFVHMVWEDSKDPDADTIIQSLLGRMCGYKFSLNSEGKPILPTIYLPPQMLEESEGAIKASTLRRSTLMPIVMPMSGRNLVAPSGRKAAESSTDGAVPLFLSARTICSGWATLSNRRKAEAGLVYLNSAEGISMIEGAPFYTNGQKNYIMDTLPITLVARMMVCEPTSSIIHRKFFESVREGWERKEVPSEPYRYRGHHGQDVDDPVVTFCITEGDNSGMYVYVNTKGAQKLHVQSLRKRIPKTTGLEIFLPDSSAEVGGGAGAVGLFMTKAATSDEHIFKSQLSQILEIWREGVEDDERVQVGQVIRAVGNIPLRIKKSAFEGGNLRALFSELGSVYGVRLRAEVMNQNEGFQLLKEITWVRA
jgi:hypothetical protein